MKWLREQLTKKREIGKFGVCTPIEAGFASYVYLDSRLQFLEYEISIPSQCPKDSDYLRRREKELERVSRTIGGTWIAEVHYNHFSMFFKTLEDMLEAIRRGEEMRVIQVDKERLEQARRELKLKELFGRLIE